MEDSRRAPRQRQHGTDHFYDKTGESTDSCLSGLSLACGDRELENLTLLYGACNVFVIFLPFASTPQIGDEDHQTCQDIAHARAGGAAGT